MMKMSGRISSCFIALFFVLTSVSAIQQLRSINSLKRINFGQSVPKHSLVLLHWFANTVEIDSNNVIWLNFDPRSGDYGSHRFYNNEGVVDPLPLDDGYEYYTIGNLNQETSTPLPRYVARSQGRDVGRNMDRIIICVREQNTGWRPFPRVHRVYITQHNQYQLDYDPDHTYRISTSLIREIREFSVGENQQPLLHLRNSFGSNADAAQLRDIRNTWGNLAALGLLLFIVIQEKSSTNQRNNRPENSRSHLDDSPSESESNDSRDRLIREEFRIDMPNNEVRNARRTTENRGSGSYNTSGNLDDKCLFCGICICFIATIIILGVILGLRYMKT